MKRISKILADCGVCSRRKAEELILDGQVTYDGKVIQDLSFKTDDYTKIRHLDKKISFNKPKLWLFHKPVGYVVSHKRENQEPIIFDIINVKERVISVGRLDKNTSGLLLLTNNGDIARMLELPSNAFSRTYQIKIFGKLNFETFKEKLLSGIVIEGFKYLPIIANLVKTSKNNHLIELTLQEGKNREIRNIMAYYDFKIAYLSRTKYGPFDINNLKMGEVKEIPNFEQYINPHKE